MRDWLCPVNRRWNLAALLDVLQRDYPRRKGESSRRFVLIEYVMLRGINDTAEDAKRCGGAAASVCWLAVVTICGKVFSEADLRRLSAWHVQYLSRPGRSMVPSNA